MALSVGYMARETGTNLKRNALMSVAATVTMMVALVLFGAAQLWKAGVERQTRRWQGGVELSVFMQPSAPDQQIQAVSTEIEAAPEVKKATFIDKASAYKEMQDLFRTQPEILDAVGEQDAPPSFRVVPRSVRQIEDIGNRFKGKPGVQSVVYAKETIDILEKSTERKSATASFVAYGMLLAAVLVILNTVRMAIFSRRREVAIMKLVGATNWFIRIPFMLEGVVQGVAGAVAAFLVVFVARDTIMSFVNDAAISQFSTLYAANSEVIGTGIWMIVVGIAVGAVGSLISVRSYLDV